MRRTAEVLIAEIGIDMNPLPTSKRLASWAGVCPGKRRIGQQTPLGHDPQGLRSDLVDCVLARTF
jgi:hypothetical protein